MRAKVAETMFWTLLIAGSGLTVVFYREIADWLQATLPEGRGCVFIKDYWSQIALGFIVAGYLWRQSFRRLELAANAERNRRNLRW